MVYAVSMSNRQFTLMKEIYETGGISFNRLLQISQTTIGGCARRAWFRYNKSNSLFVATREGAAVVTGFANQHIDRKNAKRPVSIYVKTKAAIRESREVKLRRSTRELNTSRREFKRQLALAR